MLIVLLKKLAIPVPIIGVIGAWLIRFKRQHQHKNGEGASGENL